MLQGHCRPTWGCVSYSFGDLELWNIHHLGAVAWLTHRRERELTATDWQRQDRQINDRTANGNVNSLQHKNVSTFAVDSNSKGHLQVIWRSGSGEYPIIILIRADKDAHHFSCSCVAKVSHMIDFDSKTAKEAQSASRVRNTGWILWTVGLDQKKKKKPDE